MVSAETCVSYCPCPQKIQENGTQIKQPTFIVHASTAVQNAQSLLFLPQAYAELQNYVDCMMFFFILE